jgi:cbb3-type cytochrome oxidase maturation protein
MNILLALIPISLVLLIIGIAAFFWAVRKDQFENLDAAALDVLSDDTKPRTDKTRDAG